MTTFRKKISRLDEEANCLRYMVHERGMTYTDAYHELNDYYDLWIERYRIYRKQRSKT